MDCSEHQQERGGGGDKIHQNLCFQVSNNLGISFLKLVPLFPCIAKASISCSQGDINLYQMDIHNQIGPSLLNIHNQWR